MIILDLDDTIFQTSSMDVKVFDSAINVILRYYEKDKNINIEQVIKELWSIPIDKVFSKYDTPKVVVNKFYDEIIKIDYKALEIETFADYQEISKIEREKILVTTGLKELQNAKIDALKIRNDFVEIYIDDPRSHPRIDKSKIFSQILSKSKLDVSQVWVVGDNPDSEIKAASDLGINTIQRESDSKSKSDVANFYIKTFHEIHEILN